MNADHSPEFTDGAVQVDKVIGVIGEIVGYFGSDAEFVWRFGLDDILKASDLLVEGVVNHWQMGERERDERKHCFKEGNGHYW